MSLLEKIIEDNAKWEGEYEQEIFWEYGNGYKTIESKMYDQRRWVTVFRDVVTHADYPGEYVAVTYEKGSTEMQEAEAENTVFKAVVPKQVTTTIYVTKEQSESERQDLVADRN